MPPTSAAHWQERKQENNEQGASLGLLPVPTPPPQHSVPQCHDVPVVTLRLHDTAGPGCSLCVSPMQSCVLAARGYGAVWWACQRRREATRKDKTELQNRVRKENERLHRSCKRPGSRAASRAETCPETLRRNNRARSTAPTSTHALPAGPYRGVPPHTRGSPRRPLLWTTGHGGRLPPRRDSPAGRLGAGRAPAAREGRSLGGAAAAMMAAVPGLNRPRRRQLAGEGGRPHSSAVPPEPPVGSLESPQLCARKARELAGGQAAELSASQCASSRRAACITPEGSSEAGTGSPHPRTPASPRPAPGTARLRAPGAVTHKPFPPQKRRGTAEGRVNAAYTPRFAALASTGLPP